MVVDAVVRTLRRAARRLTPVAPHRNPPGDPLMRLREEVRRSVDRAVRAVGATEARGHAVPGLASTAAYLTRVGTELEGDLALARREPDPRVRAMWADWLSSRVAEHRRLCADLRRQAHQVAVRRGAGGLSLASDQQAFLEAGLRMGPGRRQP
jgi:peptidoglycan/xylan/chitin deacetylase (PgdA/CDA1 family)